VPERIVGPANEHLQPAIGINAHDGIAGQLSVQLAPLRPWSIGADLGDVPERLIGPHDEYFQPPILILPHRGIVATCPPKDNAGGAPGGPVNWVIVQLPGGDADVPKVSPQSLICKAKSWIC
jgi:hypothetical protein